MPHLPRHTALHHDHLGRAVRAARLSLGITLRTLAARVGFTAGYLSEIENGKRRTPGGRLLAALERELSLPAGLLRGAGALDDLRRSSARSLAVPILNRPGEPWPDPASPKHAPVSGWLIAPLPAAPDAHNAFAAYAPSHAADLGLTPGDLVVFTAADARSGPIEGYHAAAVLSFRAPPSTIFT
ncbi:MAG: helix-turn-helix transcriptional regulator [Phycisphaeraceae bacterium]|nr:MAG: helix-turn-helix transcriptional regulator [Phycisphaeraceae bacterium]